MMLTADLAQSTGTQVLNLILEMEMMNLYLEHFLHLFNPSSTTYVKHFMGTFSYMMMEI
jgi:hypothetical protein